MKHVFVETNWIFDVFGPSHRRQADAVDLLERAANGEIRLYLPALSIAEARRRIPERATVKREADALRNFVRWGSKAGKVTEDEAAVVRHVVNRMEQGVDGDLRGLDDDLRNLLARPGVSVFPLTEARHLRSMALSLDGPAELESFDQAILAAILVMSEELRAGGVPHCTFCEKDYDLLPWTRKNQWKPGLRDIYDNARIWVINGWNVDEGPWEGWPDAPPPGEEPD